MPALLTPEQLQALKVIDSPTVSNAVEVFNVRPRNEGFMTPDIRCIFPELGAMVGYAATAVITASRAEGHMVQPWEVWEHVLKIPEPRVLVIHDADQTVMGAFWGEVQSNVYKALGCVGTVTDGSVRDLNEVRRLGFHFFARWVSVSHAYVHAIDVGVPVKVGGLWVKPGDLLHGDQHGVVSIPLDIAKDIPAAVTKVVERERKIINFCQSKEFSTEKLKELMQALRQPTMERY